MKPRLFFSFLVAATLLLSPVAADAKPKQGSSLSDGMSEIKRVGSPFVSVDDPLTIRISGTWPGLQNSVCLRGINPTGQPFSVCGDIGKTATDQVVNLTQMHLGGPDAFPKGEYKVHTIFNNWYWHPAGGGYYYYENGTTFVEGVRPHDPGTHNFDVTSLNFRVK